MTDLIRLLAEQLPHSPAAAVVLGIAADKALLTAAAAAHAPACRWCETGERGPRVYRPGRGTWGRSCGWVHVSRWGVVVCQDQRREGQP